MFLLADLTGTATSVLVCFSVISGLLTGSGASGKDFRNYINPRLNPLVF